MRARMVAGGLPAAALVLAFGVGHANAQDVLISNLPGNDATQSASLGDGRIKGMGFTMPSQSSSLVDVTLRMNITGLDVDPLVRIFDDVGGVPSNELLTLENPSITETGIHNLTFLPPSSFTLAADTTYWLVVYSEGADRPHWMGSSPAETPTGLATHAGSTFSASGGPNPPTGSSGILNSYEVRIPAPASVALLGLAGLVGVRRRRD